MIACAWDVNIDQSGSALLVTQLAQPVAAIHWTPPSSYQPYLIAVGEPIFHTVLPPTKRSLTVDEQRHLMGALMSSSELLYEI